MAKLQFASVIGMKMLVVKMLLGFDYMGTVEGLSAQQRFMAPYSNTIYATPARDYNGVKLCPVGFSLSNVTLPNIRNTEGKIFGDYVCVTNKSQDLYQFNRWEKDQIQEVSQLTIRQKKFGR